MEQDKPAAVKANDNGFRKFIPTFVISVALSQGLAWLCEPTHTYTLNGLALLSMAVNWCMFLHASGIIFGNARTEKFYDLTGSFTYITVTVASVLYAPVEALSVRQLLCTGAVIIWTIRLGSFLFGRICNNNGVDSRFTAIKPVFFRFLGAWTLQGLWVFLTALPVFAINTTTSTAPLAFRDAIGVGLWLFGFVFEVVSDQQKTAWHNDKANAGKFINTGLWAWSRHPNYFGEITLWTGVFILASTSFTPAMWSCTLSPLFVAVLLIYVSGIPMLERAGHKRWGTLPSYKAYKLTTPVLIPVVGRRGDAKF